MKQIILILFIITINYCTFALSGTCGTNCKWEFQEGKHILKITGTGPMDNYTETKQAPWKAISQSIIYIQFDNTITTIGNYSFTNLTQMTTINLPTNLTYIGEKAFYNCTLLSGIIIPESIKVIGDSSFEQTTNLTSVEYQGTKQPKCGTWVFSYSGVTEITVKDEYSESYFCGKKTSESSASNPYLMLYYCLGVVGGVFLVTVTISSFLTLIYMCEKPVESGYDMTIL